MIGVSRERKWNSNVTVGVAYIGIPFGVDRDKFVQICYRKERVHIILDHGGTMVKNCYIDSEVLQRIKFPEVSTELGSQVVFVMDRFSKVPFVLATVTRTRERVVGDEESINIQRSINGGLLSIIGSGDGKLLINLENIDASKVILNISGDNSVLEINNDGQTTINSSNDIILNSSSKVVKNVLNSLGKVQSSLILDERGLKYEDDKGNVLEIDYENNRINHNEGSQPIPLGTELKDQLDKLNQKFKAFLDTYVNTPVVPGDGGAASQTAVIAATSALSDADFNDINSEKSFID